MKNFAFFIFGEGNAVLEKAFDFENSKKRTRKEQTMGRTVDSSLLSYGYGIYGIEAVKQLRVFGHC